MAEARLLRPVASAAHELEVVDTDADDAGDVLLCEKSFHSESLPGGYGFRCGVVPQPFLSYTYAMTEDPKVLEALAHVATCEECQQWLSQTIDEATS